MTYSYTVPAVFAIGSVYILARGGFEAPGWGWLLFAAIFTTMIVADH